jgi:CBS domain-containing protein
MTTGVVAAHEQAPFKEIVQSLTRNRVSCVPVIDDSRRVLGIVTESDLLAHVVRHGPSPLPKLPWVGSSSERRRKEHGVIAGQLMTSPALTVRPEASVAEAARLAARNGCTGCRWSTVTAFWSAS